MVWRHRTRFAAIGPLFTLTVVFLHLVMSYILLVPFYSIAFWPCLLPTRSKKRGLLCRHIPFVVTDVV